MLTKNGVNYTNKNKRIPLNVWALAEYLRPTGVYSISDSGAIEVEVEVCKSPSTFLKIFKWDERILYTGMLPEDDVHFKTIFYPEKQGDSCKQLS